MKFTILFLLLLNLLYSETKPNELGKFLIITYHVIGEKDTVYTRTASGLREDLEFIRKLNYHPLKISNLEKKQMNVPKGKKPIFITYDDSSESQFGYDEAGRLKSESAVGIMEAFKKKYPDFPLTATFFILPGAKKPNNLFGQPNYTKQKLEFLAANNYEIQNHTLWHANLKTYKDKIGEQIVESQKLLNKYLPNYKMTSLALPFGVYPPKDFHHKLLSGEYKGIAYKNILIFDYSNRSSYSPFDSEYDVLHIRRVQAFDKNIQKFLQKYSEAEDTYISDGDPNVLSFPKQFEKNLHPSLRNKIKINSF